MSHNYIVSFLSQKLDILIEIFGKEILIGKDNSKKTRLTKWKNKEAKPTQKVLGQFLNPIGIYPTQMESWDSFTEAVLNAAFERSEKDKTFNFSPKNIQALIKSFRNDQDTTKQFFDTIIQNLSLNENYYSKLVGFYYVYSYWRNIQKQYYGILRWLVELYDRQNDIILCRMITNDNEERNSSIRLPKENPLESKGKVIKTPWTYTGHFFVLYNTFFVIYQCVNGVYQGEIVNTLLYKDSFLFREGKGLCGIMHAIDSENTPCAANVYYEKIEKQDSFDIGYFTEEELKAEGREYILEHIKNDIYHKEKNDILVPPSLKKRKS